MITHSDLYWALKSVPMQATDVWRCAVWEALQKVSEADIQSGECAWANKPVMRLVSLLLRAVSRKEEREVHIRNFWAHEGCLYFALTCDHADDFMTFVVCGDGWMELVMESGDHRLTHGTEPCYKARGIEVSKLVDLAKDFRFRRNSDDQFGAERKSEAQAKPCKDPEAKP